MDYIFNYIKKIQSINFINSVIFFLIIFFLYNLEVDNRFYETKNQIDKINFLYAHDNCKELNYLLDEYEIWVLKNIYPKYCKFYYDFESHKNILY